MSFSSQQEKGETFISTFDEAKRLLVPDGNIKRSRSCSVLNVVLAACMLTAPTGHVSHYEMLQERSTVCTIIRARIGAYAGDDDHDDQTLLVNGGREESMAFKSLCQGLVHTAMQLPIYAWSVNEHCMASL